ncbi:hypothetical protein SDC9_98278 [bioreactor metagenome]|uniref:Uncharacterized protein n=1 Tax=bioreactor metagenome TaxID=1076179 RepID=A0A645AEC1_9ZZZZ
MTVARAAPSIPIFGMPNKPNINMGSSIMFMIAPIPCVIIVNMVFPVDCSRRSNVTCPKIPIEAMVHTDK